jgi:hypothetical protein
LAELLDARTLGCVSWANRVAYNFLEKTGIVFRLMDLHLVLAKMALALVFGTGDH